MIRQLLGQQPREFREDIGVFDQLVRAQHYGLPTRLLDVTHNPLVALYFAVSANKSKRASVIVFKPSIGKQRYFDSDTVSLLSALSLLTKSEKDQIRKEIRSHYDKRSDKKSPLLSEAELVELNKTIEIQKLIQFVRQEKPDFRPIVQPIDLARPVFVHPRKHHDRIIAQNGSFVLFGLGKLRTDSQIRDIPSEEIHISEDHKDIIAKGLASVGITESSMFPEIEKAAGAIKRRYE